MSLAAAPMFTTDGFVPCSLSVANRLLVEWGHNLGPVHRPFRSEPWVFLVDGQPMSVAVSASIVSNTLTDDEGRVLYRRGQVVELARLASAQRWASRLMLRWWREVAARRWECWPIEAAVSYSQNARHPGNLYRFDGWRKVRTNCGSTGGGAWSRPRYATDAHRGAKTLWLYEYGAAA